MSALADALRYALTGQETSALVRPIARLRAASAAASAAYDCCGDRGAVVPLDVLQELIHAADAVYVDAVGAGLAEVWESHQPTAAAREVRS